MAEFFDLGTHCGYVDCRKLDFLPMKCDACSECFCGQHIQYISHECKKGLEKDNQVPICPMCNKPVPVGRNENIDIKMSHHIDSGCKIKKKKIFTNSCNVENCKKKELIPIECSKCGLNYCISHRFPKDHDCEKRKTISNVKNSVVSRANITQNNVCRNDVLDDEMLAKTLQNILMENPNLSQEEIDRKLAERMENIRLHMQNSRRQVPLNHNQNQNVCQIQ
ncbi:Zinc finger, AN1-type domain-containing protein [Strongyloides ratti]|uniref:Zinc finger, AN1-type domain-containing protein n=1 Tax=Strongyloides ratti TaxID=34506 RepID=A0A090LBW2_STRRB|nr:Zinc finger, AN1-type domain-containing protein [Strongyloides ratti]CEF67217.1 Zinc finger, AN1-type domain-containing protein [Strongyloides ratti]